MNVLELLRSVQTYSEQNPEASLQHYLERVTLFTESDSDTDDSPQCKRLGIPFRVYDWHV